MQNSMKKIRHSSIVFEKSGILSENLETLTSSNYPRVSRFLLEFCTRFLLTIVYKKVFGIFLFCLDLELFTKIKKTWFDLFFTFFLIIQDLNKNK